MTLNISFVLRAFGVLIALALLSSPQGCKSLLSFPGEPMPPTETDIAELSPDSLKAPVVDFKWIYLDGDSHIRVSGTLVNISGETIHGARIQAILYDQKGEPIARGDSFVNPSYLPVNGRGSFEFVAMVKKKQSEVTHTRLLATIRVPAY